MGNLAEMNTKSPYANAHKIRDQLRDFSIPKQETLATAFYKASNPRNNNLKPWTLDFSGRNTLEFKSRINFS
jgi:hypothetical protein